MSKINFTVQVNVESNPFRKMTLKWHLFQWCLERKQFTKEEFLAMVPEMTTTLEVTSKMPPSIQSKAWWNEFLNKHKMLTIIEAPKVEAQATDQQ